MTPPNDDAAAEQRAEIDDFLSLLDAVRADAEETKRARGTIALVAARARTPLAGGLLREAHRFLKLNLRRPDSAAFYGPTLLFVYLPGGAAGAAPPPRPRPPAPVGSTRSSVEEQRRERRPAPAATSEARMLDAIAASTRSLLGERRPAEAPRENVSPRDAHAHVEANHAEPTSHSAASGRAGALPRNLLLVVSDAPLMARLNLLLRSAGVEVRAVFDARQALGLLRVERPDLLLVDQALSDMEGVEMLRRLARASGGRLARPAVLLVAESGGRAGEEASQIGARAVASVPYNPEEILEAIRAGGRQFDRE